MNKWFYFNLLLLAAGIWQITEHSRFPAHVIFGAAGLLLFLFNWTRHAVFSTIRNTPNRQTKIKLANLSKKIVPYHRWIGTTTLIIILIHASLTINLFGFAWHNVKLLSGLIAGILLIAMVVSGWMRLFRSTGRKRMIHIWLGISLFIFISIHIGL
ncbi:hypothetical protein SAMN05216238_11022 [Lentibacillus persicus]|uniref:Ferric reductase like transmembrane component n=1 Tax=Lentibacillus persicus TaxID=640948 RepID=A0A1I1YNT6_9BACI|nr:hypothetical protein [Lentibacillus persicus]SFE20972.1 hypothetical protein SAMN05216238_11022 [Lentibacillus persicus]